MSFNSNDCLVTAAWLQAHLADDNLRIVDTRKGDGFVDGHIPRAVALGVNPMLHEPGKVIDPASFAALMSGLGIDDSTRVVVYDDGNNLFGGRLWWVLRHYGHANVRVLDGGWDHWQAGEYPIESGPARTPRPAAFVPVIDPTLIASTEQVLASIDHPQRLILDVRGDSEWLRAAPTEQSKAGHIQSAIHRVWTAVVDPVSHCFLPPDRLQALFADAGLDPDKEVIVYCQGGIRAAHTVVALKLAGYRSVRNYEGSWGEWSRADLPTVIEAPAA